MHSERSKATGTDSLETMQAQASALGVEDLFLFRRVCGEQFVHLGGLGRGVGWAGTVELDLTDNEMAAKAYRDNTVEHRENDPVGHVVGAYHARSAVAIPVNNDVLVVAGSFAHRIQPQINDTAWRRLAQQAMNVVTSASPAKRLADELEILHAVQEIATLDANRELEDVLQAIVTSAADSLSCEIGLAWLDDDGAVAANDGGRPLLERIDTEVLLHDVLRRVPQPVESGGHCQQDARKRTLPAPLGGLASSWFLLRLPDPAPGWMLLLHARDTARGFTTLCQELARKLPQPASGVLATALMHRNLRRDAQTAWAQAERDILTNVGNRTAWTRALEAAQIEIDGGRPAAILIVDIDDLKAANDHYGHDVGDRVIAATAAILSAQSRESDTVARLGGDEFALLAPGFAAAETDRLVARIRNALEAHPEIDGQIRLRASIGACAARPGDKLSDAVTQADYAMYAEKTTGQPSSCCRTR